MTVTQMEYPKVEKKGSGFIRSCDISSILQSSQRYMSGSQSDKSQSFESTCHMHDTHPTKTYCWNLKTPFCFSKAEKEKHRSNCFYQFWEVSSFGFWGCCVYKVSQKYRLTPNFPFPQVANLETFGDCIFS